MGLSGAVIGEIIKERAPFHAPKETIPLVVHNPTPPPHVFTPHNGIPKVTSASPESNDALRWKRATDLIIERRLGTVEWIHPEGADDENPKDPLVFIGWRHEDLTTEGTQYDAKTKQSLFNVYRVLHALQEKGMRKIGLEGISSDVSMVLNNLPEKLQKSRRSFPSGAELAGNEKLFFSIVEQMDKRGLENVLKYILLLGIPDIRIYGIEEPVLYDEMGHYIEEKAMPARTFLTHLNALFRKSTAISPLFNKETRSLDFVLIGDVEVPAAKLEMDLRNYLRVTGEEMTALSGKREEYFVDSVYTPDVIVLGYLHHVGLRAKCMEKKRSLCIIDPPGIAEHAEVLLGYAEEKRQQILAFLQVIDGWKKRR